MAFFNKMTRFTSSSTKTNAVVMGRNTWESIPPKFRPLVGRQNIVLSRTLRGPVEGALVYPGLEEAILAIENNNSNIDKVWVIGGSRVYKAPKGEVRLKSRSGFTKWENKGELNAAVEELPAGYANQLDAMDHPKCHRVYLTEVDGDFQCDTFFPQIPKTFTKLADHGDESSMVPKEKQHENGVDYYFTIYEKH